jgi:hypothetical protein
MKKFITFLFVGLVAFLTTSFEVDAQSPPVFSLKSIYNLTSDTVTNTATIYLTTPVISEAPATSTVIWVAVTKISGTVGGTITLQGSLDGTNFKAMNTVDTQTALATITATDATNTYHWRLAGSPFRYYRVSWTGTGTMSASFTSQIFRGK